MIQSSRNALGNVSVLVFVVAAIGLAPSRSVLAQFGGDGEGLGEAAPASPPSKFDPLVRVIQNTISPDSWDQVGGPGSIEAVDAWGVVIISQTEEVHEQIENLIHIVRQARREQQAESGKKPKDDEEQTTKPASLLVESRASSAARKRIDAALNAAASFDFVETPLADVVEFIKQKYDIEIQIDVRVLDGAGVGADTPVTRKLAGVTLRSALRLVLRDLDLTYMIIDDVLIITTPEEAESHLVTRVYKVEDLAVPVK